MRAKFHSYRKDGKLGAAAHWAVLAIGLAALAFSIGAAAASAL